MTAALGKGWGPGGEDFGGDGGTELGWSGLAGVEHWGSEQSGVCQSEGSDRIERIGSNGVLVVFLQRTR